MKDDEIIIKTVGDLVKELQKYDQNAPVRVFIHGNEDSAWSHRVSVAEGRDEINVEGRVYSDDGNLGHVPGMYEEDEVDDE